MKCVQENDLPKSRRQPFHLSYVNNVITYHDLIVCVVLLEINRPICWSFYSQRHGGCVSVIEESL